MEDEREDICVEILLDSSSSFLRGKDGGDEKYDVGKLKDFFKGCV